MNKAKERQIAARKAEVAHRKAQRLEQIAIRPLPVVVAGDQPRLEQVTPALAEQWLEHRAPNRGVQDSRVEQYARDIRNGKWNVNGETIKFDKAGQLIDGQHRLLAVTRARMPITTYVVRGLKAEAFHTIDVGMKRTAGQLLGIAGHRDGVRIAAALTWLHRYRNGTMRRQGGESSPTAQEQFALLEKEPKILDSVPWAAKMRKLKYGSLWVFLHYLLTGIDPTMADLFMEALATGVNAKEGDPTYLLREKLIDNAGHRNGRMAPPDVYAMSVRAWNATREGRTIKRVIRPREGDFDMPEPV